MTLRTNTSHFLNRTAVLEFDTTWWPSDDHVFYNPTKGATFPFFVNYRPIINRPVIVGFFCGPSARDVEAMDDAEVAARCIAELIQCTHCLDSDITPLPKPTRVVVTRWGSDENTLGSYAHIPMGASGRDCESLGRSVGPLLWAGEATSEYIGTVHGAYLSGCKAAKEAIQRYLRA
jgi:monoamine oxidase